MASLYGFAALRCLSSSVSLPISLAMTLARLRLGAADVGASEARDYLDGSTLVLRGHMLDRNGVLLRGRPLFD